MIYRGVYYRDEVRDDDNDDDDGDDVDVGGLDSDTLTNDGRIVSLTRGISRDVFARRGFRREYRSVLAKIPIVTRRQDRCLSSPLPLSQLGTAVTYEQTRSRFSINETYQVV